jgi:hypothetical protein
MPSLRVQEGGGGLGPCGQTLLYTPVFYFSLIHNFCDFNGAEMFFLEPKGWGGGEEAAWASFTVYTLNVYVLVCTRLEDPRSVAEIACWNITGNNYTLSAQP